MQVVEKTHPTYQAEKTSSSLNVALAGGGCDCKSLIQFLEEQSLKHFHGHIIGVADPWEDAPGPVYAKERGIFTTGDYRDFFCPG